jgi:signal transduction histidine kinase
MRESLRVRLVLWYALVLTLVVALYGGAVYYQSWRSMVSSVDRELEGYARDLASALRPVDGGRFDLELTPNVREYFAREGGRPYYVIRSRSGELIDRSGPEVSGAPQSGREVTVPGAGGATVVVGRDIADLRRAQWSLILNVMLAGAATLALSIFGGWFVAGRALAPIRRISETARAMSAGDLDARIAVDRTESELEQVASTLNDAFDRLRLAVEQERRFTADASHELRTPIAVLRAEVDWALDRERTQQQYRDALAVCRRAAHRMQDAVERLLALARAEASGHPPQQPRRGSHGADFARWGGRWADPIDRGEIATVPLQSLLDDIASWLAPLAQERAVRVVIEAEPLDVKGDPAQLREAVGNVVTNAILYNRPGGSVTISTRSSATDARIEVIDTGIGIPANALAHVFDRFYRVDKARSREGGGSGLGLSIARAIIEAHGGTIFCTSEEGTGSVFVISLPRDHASSEASPQTYEKAPLR